jgi:galactose mutarotase-like enzyme
MRRRELLGALAASPLAGLDGRYAVTARTLPAPRLELIVLHDREAGLEASICPSQGGELTSLRLWHKGKWTELLYRAAEYGPQEGWRGKAPLLWPANGRSLATGRGQGYLWKDRFYKMADHGFIRDLPWDAKAKGSDSSGAFATLNVKDNAGTRAQYPFGFQLAVDYRVKSGSIEIGYTVAAAPENTEPMFFSIGNHITFRTPFVDGTAPDAVRIFTPATEEIVKNSERLPTGQTRPWRLDGPVPLSRMKKNEALSLTGYAGAKPYVTLEDPAGLGIRLSHTATSVPDQPVVLFNLWGDPAAGYYSPEPWVGLQNSFNLRKGLLHLPPGGRFGWRIRIERTDG